MYYLSFFFFFFFNTRCTIFLNDCISSGSQIIEKDIPGYKTGKRLGEDSSKGQRKKKKFKYLTVLLRVFNLARGLSSGRNLSFGSS